MEDKINNLIQLTRQIIAIQLYINGATMEDICKNLKIRKTTVVAMLKGIKKPN